MKTVDDFIVELIRINNEASKCKSLEKELRYFQNRATNLQMRLDRTLNALRTISEFVEHPNITGSDARDLVKQLSGYIFAEEVKELTV